jgi:hypothetical protein
MPKAMRDELTLGSFVSHQIHLSLRLCQAQRPSLMSAYVYFSIPHQIHKNENPFAVNHWDGYIAMKGNEDAGELPMAIIVQSISLNNAPKSRQRARWMSFSGLSLRAWETVRPFGTSS